jgi:hypothetical protein
VTAKKQNMAAMRTKIDMTRHYLLYRMQSGHSRGKFICYTGAVVKAAARQARNGMEDSRGASAKRLPISFQRRSARSFAKGGWSIV